MIVNEFFSGVRSSGTLKMREKEWVCVTAEGRKSEPKFGTFFQFPFNNRERKKASDGKVTLHLQFNSIQCSSVSGAKRGRKRTAVDAVAIVVDTETYQMVSPIFMIYYQFEMFDGRF